MTDKELLELAAKAARVELDVRSEEEFCTRTKGDVHWNPLTDDGDALRLAVKLRIEVEPWIHGDSACSRAAIGEVLIDEPHYGDDPERATRRAIVRAAADIGYREGYAMNLTELKAELLLMPKSKFVEGIEAQDLLKLIDMADNNAAGIEQAQSALILLERQVIAIENIAIILNARNK